MKFRQLWRSTAVKVWLIISVIVIAIFITATIVATQVPFLSGTINSVMGGPQRTLVKGNPEDYIRYTSEYETKAEALSAANKLNEEILEEGIVLLKNKDNVLPLNGNEKITVLGKNSTNLVLGGSGSSAGTGVGSNVVNLYQSLENAGFIYNPVAREFFASSKSGSGRAAIPGIGTILTGYPIGETPKAAYENNDNLRQSYQEYNDLAIVVITRIGGEGYDMPRTMFWDGSRYTNWSGDKKIPGARSIDDHYLQLDENETDLLKEANDHFANVVVIINSSSTIEMGFLEDSNHYAYQPNIKAALWIGSPGETGANAIGRILKGEVNPSGKTTNIYPKDFRKDPTWNNFGNNLKGGGNRYKVDGKERNAFYVEYEEGIYVGYRYYETRGFTDGEEWYQQNVVYPFGHGLSYTTFSQEIVAKSFAEGANLDRDDEITISVKVKNTGNVAGKDVVQLYYTAPYYDGEIEKAHVILLGFAKTKLLEPEESQTIELEFLLRQMASYDYNDANNNDFKGYELDGGTYEIKLMNNSHQVIEKTTFKILENGFFYEQDETTNAPLNNLFDDVSSHIKTYLSRSDWQGTWPKQITDSDREVDNDFISLLNYRLNDSEDDPWYSPLKPNQSKNEKSYNRTKIKLYNLTGKDFDDPLWDELLDQLTVDQMVKLISQGNFKTQNIDNIAKPLTIDADGPMGFAIFMGDPAVYDTAYYSSAVILGSTWNEDLAYQLGKMVGNEGVIGNRRGDKMPYSGWYAPAVNIHRSQFGGRNFEYYSEDGFLSGKIAAQIIKGANEKGVYTYLKHFALNNQETNRDTTGLVTWANEQAMREIYFKPFEIAVKEGKTTAMMSAFNRIGHVWAGGDYKLLTSLLRDEWGFKGTVITDFNLTPYMNIDQMIRAGGDLNLSPGKNFGNTSSSTSVTALRNASKNILYTVANSNAMNGLGDGVVYRYSMPKWIVWVIVLDVSLVALSGLWGFCVIRKQKRKKENLK
ncbi:MAG: beta-glucosidase [Acholeplasmataceae bacterium]|nr:beta-glucosidase [Acholeplasmataceae bacterium]